MDLLHALKEETSVKATRTENGMPTHTTSMNACLDLFGSLGSARGWSEENILGAFTRALAEEPLLALRILFWAAHIRRPSSFNRAWYSEWTTERSRSTYCASKVGSIKNREKRSSAGTRLSKLTPKK